MSLSRRYRPQTFADITDQEPIKDTLRKEVETGKIAHAYLFSGPRGVGKTTTARIFAKALNCLDLKKGEPCNACALCLEANEGHMLDLIEMDAASQRRVEDVREAIIEHVRFQPARGKFKVYILDEAHMFTSESWNTLLKTLEEPPSYAVFILATTERHKVPATILSRCQQFDFKRIPDGPLGERVRDLAKAEGITIDDSVVTSVVRHSDGCVRDAETLLGQLVALGEKKVTQEIASLIIPISRLPIAAQILETCSARVLSTALAAVGTLEEEGISLLPVFDDLIEAIRFLLISADTPAEKEKLAAGDEGQRKLAQIVGVYSPAELADMALMLMERRRDAKQGIDARFALELAVTAIALGVLPHGPQAAVKTPQVPPPQPPSTPRPTPIMSSPAPRAEMKAEPEQKTEAPSPVSSFEMMQNAKVEEVHEATTLAEGETQFTIATVQRVWGGFVRGMTESNPSLAFLLKTSRPLSVAGATITIRFQYAFHRDKILADLKNRRIAENALAILLKVGTIHLEGVVGEDAEVKEKRSADMVTNILKAFGGNVVEEASEA